MNLAPRVAARRLGLVVAGARVVLAVVALVSPAVVVRPWVGKDGGDGGEGTDCAEGAEGAVLSPKVLGRALGGRDLALGVGALWAGRGGGSPRQWVWAGVLADSIDSAVTLAMFRRLPVKSRWAVLASAGAATLAGIVSASFMHVPE